MFVRRRNRYQCQSPPCDDNTLTTPRHACPSRLRLPAAEERECSNNEHCHACQVFCESPCAESYFRATECYAHYTRQQGLSEDKANAGCLMYLLQCLWQHEGLQQSLDVKLQQRKDAAKRNAGVKGGTEQAQ